MKLSHTLANSLLVISILVSTTLATTDNERRFCCLCSDCTSPLTSRLALAVDSTGYTCNALAMDMADPGNHIKAGNAICLQLKSQHFDRCCNPNHNPVPIPQSAPASPGANYPGGPFSKCDLCPNGRLPSNPGTQVAVLNYPSVSTCIGLHWSAQKGFFEDRLCRPIKNFFEVPCGCGTAPANNGGSVPVQVIGVNGSAPVSTTNNNSNSGTSGVPAKKIVPSGDSKSQNRLSNSDGNRGNLNRFRARALKGVSE